MAENAFWKVLFCLCVACWPVSVLSQGQGGALQGRVTDESGSGISGARVMVSGPAMPGDTRTTSDATGRYWLPFLPVGVGYKVRVEAAGYGAVVRKDIEIPLGGTAAVDFVLTSGTTEVVVKAEVPDIDLKSTAIGANIALISALPLARKSSDLAFLAPGVVPGDISGAFDFPSIHGASGPENVYLVDGVDLTGSGDGLDLTSLNFDFIQAVEVQTGGMGAEVGALMGGAVNSVTRSGGNEFHGSLFAYYFDDGLGAKERRLDNPNVINYSKAFKQYDIGGSLGGYIVKDKLWFFLAYDYNKTERSYTAEGTDTNVLLNGRPSYSWARSTGYTNRGRNPTYAAKLTWNVNPNHKLILSFFGNDDERDYQRNLNNPIATASPYHRNTKNYAVGLQWNATWTARFFTEVILARRDTRDDWAPNAPEASNNWLYSYWYGRGEYRGFQVIPVGPPNSFSDPWAGGNGRIDLASWRPSLGGGSVSHTKDVNDQIRFKATHLLTGWGRHELSYGLQGYDIHYDYDFRYTGPGLTVQTPGDPFFGRTSADGTFIRWVYSPSSPTSYLFRAQCFMNDTAKKTRQRYWGYWVQDNWNLTDYFMLKLGLRLDQLHSYGGRNYNYRFQPLPRAGLFLNDMWAPRLGFTWDVAHDGKAKLFGFYGQYYERVPNNIAIRALTPEFLNLSYSYDAALTQPYGLSTTFGIYPALIQGGPEGQKLKGSYNEEWILGYQWQARPDLVVGVQAIYRALGRAIEDISIDGTNSYIITNPGNWTNVWVPDPYAFLGPPYDHYFYHYPKPVRIYKALELTVDKRLSHNWALSGSYVLSRLQGNYEGLYSNDNGQLDPNITSKYDLPSILINGYGLLPNDRTHVLTLFGFYSFENIPLEVGATFTLMSGTPISAMGNDAAYGMSEDFVKERGTAGRTPTLWELGLGVQYTFSLWHSKLGLRADLFNVTNEQRTTTVEQNYNSFDNSPRQTYPYFGKELSHQSPRRVRLALRYTF